MAVQSDLSNWIGRIEKSPVEVLGPRLLDRFRASFAPHVAATTAAPAGIHWRLCPPAVDGAGHDPDGHPAKSGFLPPVPLPRRMWAGGDIEFLDPLRKGDEVVRTSRIEDIQAKTGRSGSLCFVAVRHGLTAQRGVALRERQDIVYRAAATSHPSTGLPDAREGAEAEWVVKVDSVLLFRYSALTFNGHRIHYDEAYARKVESYPGLAIHGPLRPPCC